MTSLMHTVLFSIVVVGLILPPTTAYRILGIFPHPGITHFYFFHPIMRGLADAGHDVTVISQFPDPDPPANYKDHVITGVPSLHNSVDLGVSGTFQYTFNIYSV